jgi:hypothetical protein
MAALIAAKIAMGCVFGHHLETGTRQHVLYLAQMHPKPKEGEKRGLWSPKRYFYGFYAPVLFKPVVHHKAYKNSKQFRYRVGLCEDEDTLRTRGPVHTRARFCACPNCALPVFNFQGCLVRDVVGARMSVQNCPKLAVHPQATTRTASLTEFSATLKVGEVRAVKVARD